MMVVRKRCVYDHVASKVETIVEDEAKLRSKNDYEVDEKCRPDCYYFERRLQLVLDSLRWRQLWPSSVMRKRPLEEVWKSLEEDRWTERSLVEKEISCRCHYSRCDADLAPDLDGIQSALSACLQATRDSTTAVCYYCVRENLSLVSKCVHTKDSVS